MSDERVKLARTDGTFVPGKDARTKMPEPLPVKILAVEDVYLAAAAGIEKDLDEFYVEMLQFLRDQELPLAYWADNFRVIFEVREPPMDRDNYRVLQIEVQKLAEAEQKLVERELECTRQRGLVAGSESLVLLDPAGNWVELVESRKVL